MNGRITGEIPSILGVDIIIGSGYFLTSNIDVHLINRK